MSEDVFELMQKASVRRMERPTEHPLRDSQPLRRVEVPVLVHSSTIQDLGLTPFHLTRRAGFTRVVRGVVAHPTRKVSVDVPRWADERWMGVRLRVAALQLSRPEAVASHGTAALLHGWVLPGRMQRGDQIHLTTDVSAVRRREVVSHRYEVSDVLDAYGIRLTGLSETLRDIADGLSDPADDRPPGGRGRAERPFLLDSAEQAGHRSACYPFQWGRLVCGRPVL